VLVVRIERDRHVDVACHATEAVERQRNAIGGVVVVARDGSDGTRTRDLRRDRPEAACW